VFFRSFFKTGEAKIIAAMHPNLRTAKLLVAVKPRSCNQQCKRKHIHSNGGSLVVGLELSLSFSELIKIAINFLSRIRPFGFL